MRSTLLITIALLLTLSGCRRKPPTDQESAQPQASEHQEILNVKPIITEPTHTISIQIDSIPSGADIYTVDSKYNLLGEKIGTTPFLYEIKYGSANWRGQDGVINPATRVWGKGAHLSSRKDSQGHPYHLLYAEFILVKEGHGVGILKKKLFSSVDSPDNGSTSKDLSITVSLTPPEQVIAKAQKQAPQVNQNINIQNEQDDLDTINGALDALIKLNGLGAFQ